MNVEQKYGKCGRISDGFYHEEIPPEDWQFENSKPIKITGRKPMEVPKLNLGAILPPKEATNVKFKELDLDKQAKLVAEEYMRETSISGRCNKFGIGSAKLYEHIHQARDMGLITELRSERKNKQDPQVAVKSATAEDSSPTKANISVTSAEDESIFVDNGIKDSGHRREFDTGAVRDMAEGKGRYDLVPWVAIDELAKHCEHGAIKYGERNCEKGIPVSSLIDSAFRHLSKYIQGADDEPHLTAAFWNIAYAIYHEKVNPEMQDIPTRL